MTANEATVDQRPSRVFVSYAHESPEHEDAVRALWFLLRTLGVDARLDLPAAERRQDWPLWMLGEVRQAEFVLVIASPAYCRRAEGSADADEGRGVQFEAALIRGELYADREAGMRKFLPVLLPGMSTEDIPVFLGPTTATYRVSELSPGGIERLLRVLTGQPWELEPPLGQIPVLAPRAAPAATAETPGAIAHEVVLDVICHRGRLRCRALLAGTVVGEREAVLPFGISDVWGAIAAGPVDGAGRLHDVGARLSEALLDDLTVERLAQLVDQSALGTAIDVVVVAEGEALMLPLELLCLRDGRLLVAIPGVAIRRRVRGLERGATASLPGPLKVLVAVAAPEETATSSSPLDVEAEMQAILDATASVDASGEVRILEVAGLRQIAEALRESQCHVLHLSAHGSQAALELENEDGEPVAVAAADLVAGLRSGGRPLPLIVLSSCAAAAGGGDGLAAKLVRGGADRVIAMQAAVSDDYATKLAAELYDELVRSDARSVSTALARARRTLQEAAREAAQVGAPWLPEHAVATLLCAEGDPALVDAAAAPVALSRRSEPPVGGGVRRLPVGYLIGRRGQLRTALLALRGGRDSDMRFGAISGVLLTGVGGIGKSAVAGRIETRLREDGWLTAVHFGRWNPALLITAVTDAIAAQESTADPLLIRAHALLASSEAPDTAKMDCVRALLQRTRLLVVW